MSDNGIPLVDSVNFSEHARKWSTTQLPVVDDDYDKPLTRRRDDSASTNIELHPSMIPFVTQFRAEEDLKHNRKVLVTYAHINHNTVVVSRCAEIANNLAGNKVNHKFTQNPEIRNGLELFFYNWKKDEVLQHTDLSVLPMYKVCQGKDSSTVLARLTPSGTFESAMFENWLLNGGGSDYLKIDATTKEGQEQLANANSLELESDFWDQPLHKSYLELYWRVQQQGVKDGWSCCAEEGMHRYTATLAYYLCGLPDENTGYLTLDSLTEKQFVNYKLGKSSNISPIEFRNQWYHEVFYDTKTKDHLKKLPLTVRYWNKPNLNSGEAAWWSRAYSQCQMVGRKESCNRSPLDLIGDLMANDIKSMTIDQASRRADFGQIVSPNYNPAEKDEDIYANLNANGLDVEAAYPWTELYETLEYQSFIKNPLEKNRQIAVKTNVLNFTALRRQYHMLINDANEEMTKIDENSEVTAELSPPFLPSFLSMAQDTGNNFREGAFLNPEVVNGAYYGPMIITYLYAMYSNILVHRVFDNGERLQLIKFFLRFVNNTSTSQTMTKVHHSWHIALKLPPTSDYFDCVGAEVIIGCTQVILSFFNSLLSTEMEKVADKKWNERRQALDAIGTRFSALMERVGQQVLGITTQNQLKTLALIKPLSLHQATSYFDHFAQHAPSQAKGKSSHTKVRKPWIKIILLRNIDVEIIQTILLVGLFPTLSEDYQNYTNNFDILKSPITSVKPDRQRERMIHHIGTILSNTYNPMQPNKTKSAVPRDTHKWIKMILQGREDIFPLSWFHIVYLYSLGFFDSTQDKRTTSMFNNQWLADYTKTGYDQFPRMTPCLRKKKQFTPIVFYTSLARIPPKEFSPHVFSDIAPIVLNTNNAINLPDLQDKLSIVNAWKKANPTNSLLNAVDIVISSPVKARKSSAAPPVSVEDVVTGVTSLPGQDDGEESDGSQDEFGDTEGERLIIEDILQKDWKNFDYSKPIARYKQKPGGPTKLQHYTVLLEKCKVRDLLVWMRKQHHDDLHRISTTTVNPIEIMDKLSSWGDFKYATTNAQRMLAQEEEKENKKNAQKKDDALPPVQHATTTTIKATAASATPPAGLPVSQMMNQLGNYQIPVMNRMVECFNHLFHHASVIEAVLDRQSESLLSAKPPQALTVFNDAAISLRGLRTNISQFAKTFGVESDKLLFCPPLPPPVDQSFIDHNQLGQKKSEEETAAIITTIAMDYGATNFKAFDIRHLIQSMNWNSDLAAHLDPSQIESMVLLFGHQAKMDLQHQYFDHDNQKPPTTNVGKLSVYLRDLASKGWVTSFDKHSKEHESRDAQFFLVLKEMDQYLSNWTPPGKQNEKSVGMITSECTPHASPPDNISTQNTAVDNETNDTLLVSKDAANNNKTTLKRNASDAGNAVEQTSPSTPTRKSRRKSTQRNMSESKTPENETEDVEHPKAKKKRKTNSPSQTELMTQLSSLEQRHRDHIRYLQSEKEGNINAVQFFCSIPDRKHSYGKGDILAKKKADNFNQRIARANLQYSIDRRKLEKELYENHE